MNNIDRSHPGKRRSVFPKKPVILSFALIMTFLLIAVAAPGRVAAEEDDKRTKRKDPDRGRETRRERVDPDRTRGRKERGETGRQVHDNAIRRPRRPSRPRVPVRPSDPGTISGSGYVKPEYWCIGRGPRDFNLGHVEIIVIDRFLPDMYDGYTDPFTDEHVEGLFNENSFFIALPFGSILPWEVGEDFLIWLRSLEDDGQEQASVICIIQMMEPGGFDDFLARFGREDEEIIYYDTLSDRSFLASVPVRAISRLLSDTGIRWVGEYRDEYKIVPGGNGLKIYISSLEGDRDEFRADLEASGLKIEGFREITGEYVVRGRQDTLFELAGLWWVGRISGRPSMRTRYSDDHGQGTPGQ